MNTMQEDRLVVHPMTGEVQSLNAPTGELARWLHDQRELDERLREEKRRVVAEILRRMDREARYTMREDGLEITGGGPQAPREFEGEAIRAALAEYVEDGVISQEALDRAVEVVPTYKPKKNGLTALSRISPEIATIIDQHSHEKESHERRVQVKRAD